MLVLLISEWRYGIFDIADNRVTVIAQPVKGKDEKLATLDALRQLTKCNPIGGENVNRYTSARPLGSSKSF